MKRPAMLFYPADWRNNAKLRRCSWAARGVWIEVMGLMHDSDEYGVLRWGQKEIAQALGCQVLMIRELSDKGVLKGAETGATAALVFVPKHGRVDGDPVTILPSSTGPLWYSSRMLIDEYKREKRGNVDSPKDAPIPPIGAAPKNGNGAAPSRTRASSSFSKEGLTSSLRSDVPIKQGVDSEPLKANSVVTTEKGGKTGPVWDAYSEAYRRRWGAEPTPNGKVRGMLARFLERVPVIEAPAIAAFYVTHNRGLYVSSKHCVDLMLRDAESLRTEWLTGRTLTDTEARQADRTQATGNTFAGLIAEAEERERGTH